MGFSLARFHCLWVVGAISPNVSAVPEPRSGCAKRACYAAFPGLLFSFKFRPVKIALKPFVVNIDRLAYRVFIAEQPASQSLGEKRSMGIVQPGFGIADHHRKRKDIEYFCIGYADTRIGTAILVRSPYTSYEHPGHCLNFGEFAAQMRGHGLRSEVVALAADIL